MEPGGGCQIIGKRGLTVEGAQQDGISQGIRSNLPATDTAIEQLVNEEIKQIQEIDGCWGEGSGSTYLRALIGEKIHVSSLGDTEAYLIVEEDKGNFTIKKLNTIDKPSDPEERDRILGMGGEIALGRSWKEKRGLNVTAGLGDREFGDLVRRTARHTHFDIPKDKRSWLLLNTDGLFEGVSAPLAEEKIKSIFKGYDRHSPSGLAEILVTRGLRYSSDNMTACVIDLTAFQKLKMPNPGSYLEAVVMDGHGPNAQVGVDRVIQRHKKSYLPYDSKNERAPKWFALLRENFIKEREIIKNEAPSLATEEALGIYNWIISNPFQVRNGSELTTRARKAAGRPPIKIKIKVIPGATADRDQAVLSFDPPLEAGPTRISGVGKLESTPSNFDAVAFLKAARNGDIAEIKNQLNLGANVNCCDDNGDTALSWAAYKGHIHIIKILLEAGSEINHANQRDVTPLMEAAEKGHIEAVKIFLEKLIKDKKPVNLAAEFEQFYKPGIQVLTAE